MPSVLRQYQTVISLSIYRSKAHNSINRAISNFDFEIARFSHKQRTSRLINLAIIKVFRNLTNVIFNV